jgi:phage terminase large subunit-like protein
MLVERALLYANKVVAGDEITPWEVKKQCEIFLRDYDNEDDVFYFDEDEIELVETLLSLMNFATGINCIGKSILDGLHLFQCFFIVNVFGFRYKNNPKKFKHQDVTLFIPRKNAKTFILAVTLIILMLTENDYSEFYSICIDRELAGEVKKCMTQIIDASPALTKRFKKSVTLSGKITCLLTNSYYQARTSESGRNNAIRPSAFIADEIGNFRDYDNITAMKSGQLSVVNPLMLKATTAYALSDSIMLEELDYIRKVLRGDIEDRSQFALIYYAEKGHEWDDIGLYMSNPLRIEENYDEIRKSRTKALNKPLERTEFLTKHMNIFINSIQDEPYLKMEEWKKYNISDKQFRNLIKGQRVVVALDLSITTDLTAVGIGFISEGRYYFKSHGFLPRGNLGERQEKINYYDMERLEYCTLCDGLSVNYNQVYDYIMNIESEYDCSIAYIISDPYNAKMMLEDLAETYDVIELKQCYSQLTTPTKEFRNEVYNGNVYHVENRILDWCMGCMTLEVGKSEDVMPKRKYKNRQRIDMAVVCIFAFKLLFDSPNMYDWDNIIDENWSC